MRLLGVSALSLVAFWLSVVASFPLPASSHLAPVPVVVGKIRAMLSK